MSNKNWYQTFLEQKHQQFDTSKEVLNQLVQKAVNSQIKHLERVIQGETNEVYRVTTSDDQSIIIRVSHQEDRNFEQEKWAQTECDKKGIPTAKILLIEHLKSTGHPISVCIMEKLPGITLDTRPIIPPAQDKIYLEKICTKAGNLLSKIHSIKTNKFGELNAKGSGSYSSLTEIFAEKIEQKKLFYEIVDFYEIPRTIIDQILLFIRKNISLTDINGSVLIHGDFGPKHIMVDSEKITGIIDFGEAKAGHPIQDFAQWDLWYSHQIPTEILMQEYEDQTLFNSNFQTILKLMVFLDCLNMLYHYHQQNSPQMVHHVIEKLHKYL